MHIEMVKKGLLRQKHHWLKIAPNGEPVSHSENYYNEKDCYESAVRDATQPVTRIIDSDGNSVWTSGNTSIPT